MLHCVSCVICLISPAGLVQAFQSLAVFLPALGFTLSSAHTVSPITPGETLHWVSMPRCWQRGGGCRAPSVMKRMGLLCARHRQLQQGAQLSPSASQVREWRREGAGREAPGARADIPLQTLEETGAGIHTAAHEGKVAYFLKELHSMENPWQSNFFS